VTVPVAPAAPPPATATRAVARLRQPPPAMCVVTWDTLS
jgi:hypothetical protein